ncbi:MAG: tetratricopeptide repeat protein [Polyangiales bacterium]
MTELQPQRPSCIRLLLSVALLGAATPGCVSVAEPRPSEVNREATRPAPDGPQLLEIAAVLVERGDRVRAAQYLTLAQREGVPAQQVVPRLLQLYAADGQYRLAIDAAELYLRRHPHDRKVRRCLGAFYLAVDATSEALATFEHLVRTQPDDAEAHFALASLLQDARSQRARADAHFRTYLALAPTGRYAEEARARLLTEVP